MNDPDTDRPAGTPAAAPSTAPTTAPAGSSAPAPRAESLFEHDLASLTATCEAMALPRRTGGQVLKWVYEKGIVDFAQMSDLSKDARAKLTERFCGLQGTVIRHQVATDDTQKLLIEWGDAGEAPAESLLRIAGTRTGGECCPQCGCDVPGRSMCSCDSVVTNDPFHQGTQRSLRPARRCTGAARPGGGIWCVSGWWVSAGWAPT